MVYGPHGVGKSSFAAAAEAPIFLPIEDGVGEIDCHSFPLVTSYDECLEAISELYGEEHPYRTVVVDSLDWLERMIWSDVCRKRGLGSIEDAGFGKGYVFALDQWREFLEGLDALRNERGLAIVLIAHAKIERYDNPETDSYDRFAPRLHKLASDLIQEWCDEVLFAGYRVHTKETDEGFGRKGAKGLGTGERVLRTSQRPAHVAKNRLDLPSELPLDWNAYAERFPTAAAPAVSD